MSQQGQGWNMAHSDSVKASVPSYLMDAQQIKQGAEARVYRGTFLGRSVIIKERFPKLYRHPEVDEKLTRRRTTQEVRSILRCRRAGQCTATADPACTLQPMQLTQSTRSINSVFGRHKTNDSVAFIVFLPASNFYISALPEDKGVDLYVLEKAFLMVIKKLDEVRLRGRKRSMVG
uniref:non-specific serine/threonine protein kinase n=1 Tax=Sinocyclocheilus rhinocerous TaxID=307959 RepID=A0A673H907_9TELE